jgi:hypothetical protein
MASLVRLLSPDRQEQLLNPKRRKTSSQSSQSSQTQQCPTCDIFVSQRLWDEHQEQCLAQGDLQRQAFAEAHPPTVPALPRPDRLPKKRFFILFIFFFFFFYFFFFFFFFVATNI